MTRYLLAVHTADGEAHEPMTEEQMRQGYEQVAGLEREMNAEGALLFSGRLEAANTATVVRASDGDVLTTDGPYLEAKEAIGGFYIIEAKDYDAALAWASKTSAAINMPIEVRPFLATSGGAAAAD